MRIAIIADDFTGANDSGVQFACNGMRTAVLFQPIAQEMSRFEVVIIDTDSRSASPELAYHLTRTASDRLRLGNFDVIYKKIDSTMRGNVGVEFDAIYDSFRPDFIFFTPAYPDYSRQVKDGYLFLNGQLLHETGFARDPKTPAKESFIPNIIESNSKRRVGILSVIDCEGDRSNLLKKLFQYYAENRTYILFDAMTDQDLRQIVACLKQLPFSFVCAGSAGLAKHLVPMQNDSEKIAVGKSNKPILTVIGSVNRQTRKQTEVLLSYPNVVGIRLRSDAVVVGTSVRDKEISRIVKEAGVAIQQNQDIALYTAGEPREVEEAQAAGANYGLNQIQVSDRISEAMGLAVSQMLDQFGIDRLILTGGDTAKRVCEFANINRIELIDEVEPGVPLGILNGRHAIYGITKAGGFGSDQVFIRSLNRLKGDETACVQS